MEKPQLDKLVTLIGKPLGKISLVGIGAKELVILVLSERTKDAMPSLFLDQDIALVREDFARNIFCAPVIHAFDCINTVRNTNPDFGVIEKEVKEFLRVLENSMELSDFERFLLVFAACVDEIIAFTEKNLITNTSRMLADIKKYVLNDKLKNISKRLQVGELYA